MESLLSLAFDNLSSYDSSKIRKGLRQIEGLLAQLCLSSSTPSAPSSPTKAPANKRHSFFSSSSSSSSSSPLSLDSSEPTPPSTPPRKQLSDLCGDPAFREFFKLQEGFEWNVALRLVQCLDRLLGKNDGGNDLLILACLDLIQGVLLLHPPSRVLFSREIYMNHLLDLLEPINPPAIQSATLHTLVCALLSQPSNTRTFEALDGLLTITSLFKSRSTSREVKLKLVEFLYFYLLPETPSIPSAGARDSVPAMLQRSPSKLAGAFGRGARTERREEGDDTRTTREKQYLLSQHLSSVDDLVKDLRESAPFGGVFT